MNILHITLGVHQSKFESVCKTIDEIRTRINKPIEVEAFGPQIFLSIIGSKQDVSIALMDENNNVIDSENYKLGAK